MPETCFVIVLELGYAYYLTRQHPYGHLPPL